MAGRDECLQQELTSVSRSACDEDPHANKRHTFRSRGFAMRQKELALLLLGALATTSTPGNGRVKIIPPAGQGAKGGEFNKLNWVSVKMIGANQTISILLRCDLSYYKEVGTS